MYLNVSAETMPKDIAPFEVGYEMAAFRSDCAIKVFQLAY